jgi:hypothetical protein
MGAIQDLIRQIRGEAPKQEAAILDIVAENETLLVDMNTAQLMQGLDADSVQLKKYASEHYAMMKASLNPRHVTDLNLTGAFHRSFVAITDKWPVMFSASDSKTDELTKKYGENIFGLTEKNKTLLAQEYIKEPIIKYYRNLFQL